MHSETDLKYIENDLKVFYELVENSDVNEEEINDLIKQIFVDNNDRNEVFILKNNNKPFVKLLFKLFIKIFSFLWICLKISVLLLLFIIIVSTHPPSQRFILRHSQELIYPVMRQLRLWSLPLIRDKSYLNRWHVEECLIDNPFYSGSRLECWPCDDMKSAIDLSDWHHLSSQYVNNEKPFIVSDVINDTISAKTLFDTYMTNKEDLSFGTAAVVSNNWNQEMNNLNDLMQVLNHSINDNNNNITNENKLKNRNDFHFEWKMNRVEAARVIRKLFIRPYFVPKTSEVALQRYVLIDGPQSAQYYIPMTEFANVWLTQGIGFRHIVLDPSQMCANNCSTFSVILKPKDVLYYNWQFYRPRSLAARIPDSDQLSITFVASFY